MGITSSRSIKYDETIGNIKIPKHLQPLKRKQTKKRSTESIAAVNNPPKVNEPMSNKSRTISNSQFTWSNGRKYPSEVNSSTDVNQMGKITSITESN